MPSGSIYGVYIYIFWHSTWHSIWHSFWHSICHLFWHTFWHIFWHSFWHSLWHSVWHVFGSRRAQLTPDLAIWCWGPGMPWCSGPARKLHLCWNLETLTWLGNKQLYTGPFYKSLGGKLPVPGMTKSYKSYIQRPTNSAHRHQIARGIATKSPWRTQPSPETGVFGPVIDHRSYGSYGSWGPQLLPIPIAMNNLTINLYII